MSQQSAVSSQQSAVSSQQSAVSSQQSAVSSQQRRSVYLDTVKGTAIFLMVWGHCIQFFSVKGFDFFGDIVFKIIYSFHMPLFGLVSGYLFYSSFQRKTHSQIFLHQIRSLIIPCLIWGIIRIAFVLCFSLPYKSIFSLLKLAIFGLWFLWALFLSSMAVITARKFFRDSLICHAGILCVLLFCPVSSASIFIYPYFVAGYIFHREGFDVKIQSLPLWLKISGSIAVISAWLIMFQFFGHDSYVYTTGISLMKYRQKIFMPSQLLTDIFRWVIGFAGSISVMILLKLVKPVKIIALLGAKTLGVYILSGYIFEALRLNTSGHVIHFAEAVIVTAVCYALTVIISRNKLLNKLLFGGR